MFKVCFATSEIEENPSSALQGSIGCNTGCVSNLPHCECHVHITAAISKARLGSVSVEQNCVDHWNQTIASRLVMRGKKNPNSSVESVNIMQDGVTMTWKVSS